MLKIGSPRVPLALCPKTKACWVAESVDMSTVDYNTTVKSNFVPTVTFNIDIPNNRNLGSFYNGDVNVVTKDSAIHPTSAVRQIMEIGAALKDKLEEIIFYL